MKPTVLAKEIKLDKIQEAVRACIQCGTCTASCPNAFAMDYTPRRMWRMVLTGEIEDLFSTKTFALCSACYYCTLRCPRGLPLTDAIYALKQIAVAQKADVYRSGTLFYEKFMDSVRRYGRVREMEFMAYYFAALKNPLIPLQFTPLGIKLMRKRKVHIQLPSVRAARLEAMFKKAEELEER